MKPAQIRVFDGLRLTTEHLEHLQQSLLSAVQDLREIAGVALVYRGLDVAFADEKSITVQPGLAFDAEKNRIVIDEPQTVEIEFGPATTLFVCARHETVEEGEVENHPTIIWDSGAIVVQPPLPEPAGKLLPIAELVRDSDGTRAVRLLNRAVSVPAAGAGPSADLPAAGSDAAPAAAPRPRSGVVSFASEGAGFDLTSPLLALQTSGALARPGGVSQLADSLFTRDIETMPDYDEVRCYLAMTLTVSWTQAEAAAAQTGVRAMTIAANGDAHLAQTAPSTQLGAATVHYAGGAAPILRVELSDGAIAIAPLHPLVSDLAPTETIAQILQPLNVGVRVERVSAAKIRVSADLECPPGITLAPLAGLDRHAVSVGWTVRFGWSGVGIRGSVVR
jgi:hypothetical protein